jgi:hypothetical protein
MNLRSLILISLMGSALAFGQDDEELVNREPIWKRARNAAERAIERGDSAEARVHLLEALRWKPNTEVERELIDLLIEQEKDETTSSLWALRALDQAMDSKGRGRLPDSINQELGALAAPARALFQQRIAALAELERLRKDERRAARRGFGQLLIVEWAAETAHTLLSGAPSLKKTFGDSIDRDRRPFVDAEADLAKHVVEAISKLARTALSKGNYEDAIRAGRILVGLNAQANTKGLRSDVPLSMSGAGALGSETVASARKKLRNRRKPYTLEELEMMTPAEQAEFEDTYTEFGFPAVAISPTGKYRIETSCGYETLLGITDTVELHHDRLVNWFGQDPFEGRQGLVRIVPDIQGLEAEGGTKWWAGGFQGGDTTVIRFAMGTIEGVGRTLTHELTHRFDGAIYRGMPGWGVEGRASWTGAAYGWSGDTEFVEDFATGGSMHDALVRGYMGAGNLKDILNGENERYRDNYTFGYAMWVFITTWEIRGERVFEPKVEEWMLGSAKPRGPLDWFSTCFIDGKDGRPESFEDFHKEWNQNLNDWWSDPPDKLPAKWIGKRHTSDNGGGPGSPLIYDRETWPWTLGRAEPLFGQHHARDAGHLLADLGQDRDAIAAFLWSMIVDPRTPDRDQRLMEVLERSGSEEESWLLNRRYEKATGVAPFLKKIPQTAKVLEASSLLVDTEEGVAELEEGDVRERGGRLLVRRALRADHDLIAERIGADLLGPPPSPEAPAEELALFVPFSEPEWLAGSVEWAEDDLVGYEERRVAGLWYYEERQGDLHIGREKPREGTGELDRSAHRRDAFCYADTWMQEGRYRLRADVNITTSYVNGAIILGHERFDRKVSFGFSAGDYNYAIGKKEEFDGIEKINWSLGGRFERAGHLGIRAGGAHTFERPTASFEVELLVDGSLVLCFIEGEYKGSYRSPDGSAIEGFVGFATSRGAVRISGASLQRLDRARSAELLGRLPHALDLDESEVPDFRELSGVPVEGLPRSKNGTFAVWLPLPELDEEDADAAWKQLERRTKRYVSKASDVLNKLDSRIPLHLLLPTGAGKELQDKMKSLASSLLLEDARQEAEVSFDELLFRAEDANGESLSEEAEEAMEKEHMPRLIKICTRSLEVHLHAGPGEAGWTPEDPTGTDRAAFLFIDPAGVIRAQQLPTSEPNAAIAKWLRVFRSGEAPAPARRPSEEHR